MTNRPPIQRARGFTPEAVENARHRYVETSESMESIAADLGVHRNTLDRLAKTEGWPLRKDRPPLDLPPALRLNLSAAQILNEDAVPDAEAAVEAANEPAGAKPDAPTLALRLERAVARQLAKVERLKEETGSETRRSMAAERIARTLSALTQTLFKVRALREPGAVIQNEQDDLPGGADDFRRELARRIDAFVASRADGGVAGGGERADPAPPAP